MLTLTSVYAGYDSTPVLHDLTFEVRRGEIAAFIGRNGVGKTTLARTVIGLIKPTQGSVLFADEDVTGQPARSRARKGVGYVPQGRGIFGDLTVEDNLKLGRTIGPLAPRPLEYAYDMFPILGERRSQIAGTMSGGQQQQLAIARALIGQPDLLLLDEPSDGIQPNIVEQIGELCKKLNRDEGLTICLIEQNVDLITSCAHRCLLLEKGQITQRFSPDKLQDPEVARMALAI